MGTKNENANSEWPECEVKEASMLHVEGQSR